MAATIHQPRRDRGAAAATVGKCRNGHRQRFGNGRRHRCNEPVAAARKRLDEPRILGGIVEGVTQLADGAIQADFEIHERIGRPEHLLQLVAGHDFARPAQEELQNLKGLLREADLQPMPAEFAGISCRARKRRTCERLTPDWAWLALLFPERMAQSLSGPPTEHQSHSSLTALSAAIWLIRSEAAPSQTEVIARAIGSQQIGRGNFARTDEREFIYARASLHRGCLALGLITASPVAQGVTSTIIFTSTRDNPGRVPPIAGGEIYMIDHLADGTFSVPGGSRRISMPISSPPCRPTAEEDRLRQQPVPSPGEPVNTSDLFLMNHDGHGIGSS